MVKGYRCIEQWHTVAHSGTHGRTVRHSQKATDTVVGVGKIFLFSERSVGMHFKPYGGKTGRAMIKYPLYRKNAQGLKRALYPGLTIVSLDRIITYMPYYYVLARKGSQCHRYYVQLDPESADTLHDVLVDRYDLVQVCAVPDGSVEPDIVISPAP